MKYNQFPKSQYTKKYSQAIDAVLMKQIVFDYLRIFKMPGVTISSDAQGCFDQMALAIGSLCFQCLKVPQRSIQNLMMNLRQMRHYICTAHGDFEKFYSGSFNKQLQRNREGNGAANPCGFSSAPS